MVAIEYILLMNTAVFSIVLIVLLFFASKKSHKPQRKVLSKDMRKIKDQVSEE